MEKDVVFTDPQHYSHQEYNSDCTDIPVPMDVFMNPDDFIDRAGC